METRANHVWVGVVTLILLAALAAFFVVLAGWGERDRKEYDILFQQSVGGLATGSAVSFAGVPVGQVTEIALRPNDPEYVRVRIRVEDDVPVLVGTVASISFSFTGLSTLNLDGAVRGAPPISCDTTDCPEGVPIIPTQEGAIDEILSSAPILLERLATLTERLTRVLDDENQSSIRGILQNTDRMSRELANAAPQIQVTLTELQGTLAQSTETLEAFENTLETTDQLLENDGVSLAAELRATLQSARSAADSLDATLQNVEPMTQQLASDTLPEAEATLRELRETSAALRGITESIENEGAGSLFGGRALPEYEP